MTAGKIGTRGSQKEVLIDNIKWRKARKKQNGSRASSDRHGR